MRISLRFFLILAVTQLALLGAGYFHIFYQIRNLTRENFATESERVACAMAYGLETIDSDSEETVRRKMNFFITQYGLDFVHITDKSQGKSLEAGSASSARSEDLFVTYCEPDKNQNIEVAVGRDIQTVLKAEASVNRISIFAILFEFCLLFFVSALAAVFVQRKVKPIMELCQEFKKGNFSARSGFQGTDEFSVIGEQLNSLAEEVEVNRRHEFEAKQRETAQAKLAALGEMAGGIAHEINNPLAIIEGRIFKIKIQLKNHPSDNDGFILTELDKISKVTERIARIVRGLRNFARDGSSDPFEICDLKAIIDESMSLCQSKLNSQRIAFRVECPPDLKISARAVEISQVILNLLNNAAYALRNTEKPEIALKVALEGSLIHLDLKDNGPGIPESVKQKIMQPFFTTKPVGEGTGLGLSISLGIARAHGGSLVVLRDQDPTIFRLTLPLAAESEKKAV